MPQMAGRLAELSDQQVLAVLDAVVGEIATSDTPEGAEQTEALGALLSMEHIQLNVGALTDASQAAAAAAARQLIALLAGVPEIEPSVNEWLADPPSQEAAAIPLILAAPVVLTGCVVLLQLVGHTSFRRDGNGKWSVSYDPGRRTPFDGTLGELVGALAKIMQGMTPPSS